MDNSSISCAVFSEENQCETVIALKNFTSSLSLIGSLFMLFLVIFFKKYEYLSGQLLLNLSTATFLDSLIFVVNHPVVDKHGCNFLGAVLTYADWVLLLAICAITYCIIRRTKFTKQLIVLFSINWILPVLPTVLPFIQNAYGNAGPWCWVVDIGWRFGVWFVPFILIMLALLGAYIAIIIRHVRENNTFLGTNVPQDRIADREFFLKEIRPLFGYPLAFWILKFFAVINRSYSAVNGVASYPLYILMVLCSPIVGAAFTLIFCLDSNMRIHFTHQAFVTEFNRWSAGTIEEIPYHVEDFDVQPNDPEV